ncbi:MAG: diguanylate cyclase [Oscillospiraceae bacterium]|nr:diguanylate cyclase [Oscillospiraceae bacterium]
MIIRKDRKTDVETIIKNISDSYDADFVVIRNDSCETLFMNAAAKKRFDLEVTSNNCKIGYSDIFPELCEKCRRKYDAAEEPVTFDMKDRNGRVFSVIRNTIDWIDGKPATSYIVRDVDDERSAKLKMYNLAYIDQLTGIPNRQKLKEDFEASEKEIKSKTTCGIIAIIDLDNFKAINDNYGHNTGDDMLKRITAHFEADSDFKGHLYRLGGDEFVLFCKEKPSRFESQSVFRSYFQEMLQKALLSYTMPNIEDKCTLSIGVSLYPAHGETLTELLRKADIALYKAKSDGRNRAVLFEDKYDASKKFKDLYISMQPILLKNGNTYGYELMESGKNEKEDDDTFNLAEIDPALDALGLNDIRDSTKYFVSFTKQLFNKAVLKNLPKSKFVIQINAQDKCTEEKMQLFKQLRSYGYMLSLSNVDSDNLNQSLLDLVDYCRFSPDGMSGNEQMRLIAANPTKTFIAADVSSFEDFETMRRRGFTLFQGYYFNQPVLTRKEKDIEPLKTNYFRLMQLTSTDDYVDFNKISDVISSDVALSYKLLRLLNSASVGLRTRVSSILMAVTYLGEDSLKQWISVLALRGISNEKPLELVRMSLIRARLGEMLAPSLKPPMDAKDVFMVGLLSLLHIALDKTKEEMLNELSMADRIRDSLLCDDGPYSELLVFFKNYEHANWDEVTRFSEKYGISCASINYAYVKSVKWCNDLIDAY